MAHIVEKAPKRKEVIIYAIVSPFEQRAYINRTGAERLYKTYVEHVNERVSKTASLFHRAKEVEKLPAIFVLDRCFATAEESFGCCVAWTRYFADHGISQVYDDVLREYAEDLVSRTLEYYAEISQKPLSEVLCPEGGCFPDYQIRNPDANHISKSNDRRCTICLTKSEYETIQKSAQENKMSVSCYCRKMALNGRILQANIGFMGTLMADYKQVKVMLQQIMHNIYIIGEYLPADMINIQKCIDHVTEIHLEMIKKLCQLIETLVEEG